MPSKERWAEHWLFPSWNLSKLQFNLWLKILRTNQKKLKAQFHLCWKNINHMKSKRVELIIWTRKQQKLLPRCQKSMSWKKSWRSKMKIKNWHSWVRAWKKQWPVLEIKFSQQIRKFKPDSVKCPKQKKFLLKVSMKIKWALSLDIE